MSNHISTSTADVYRKESGVMVIHFKTDHFTEREQAIEIIDAMLELGQGKKYYVLVNALDITSNMSTDAQKYFAHESPFNEFTKAVGIVLNNLAIRLTAKFFIMIQKPPFPTRIFPSLDEAELWFSELSEQESA